MLQQTPIRRHRLTAAAAVCLMIVLPRADRGAGLHQPVARVQLRPRRGVTQARDVWSPLVCGTVAGLGGTYYATRIIKSFLFQVTPHDPPTLAAAVAVLAAAAYLAAWLPARPAAAVNPIAALRSD